MAHIPAILRGLNAVGTSIQIETIKMKKRRYETDIFESQLKETINKNSKFKLKFKMGLILKETQKNL